MKFIGLTFLCAGVSFGWRGGGYIHKKQYSEGIQHILVGSLLCIIAGMFWPEIFT